MRLIRLLLLLLLLPVSTWAIPPTPTNTPRAHPLAPSPHTSVGLVWIYTDPNTGRQWALAGGTYKIKRCTGAGCTPTVVIASGVTNVVSGVTRVDYQDTGLTANTTYGYRYLANDGTDSGDSPTVYVTTLAADSNFVQFPNADYEELLGPLVESAQIPFAYYRDVMTAQAAEMIAKFPVVAPSTLLGTGSTTSGSNILTGVNTRFLEQVAANNPTCLDAIQLGGVNLGAIASVDSNTQITLVNNAPSTQSGAALTTNIAGLCGFGDPLSDYIIGNQLGYYDSALAMTQVYFMTGDPQYLRGAVRFSEAVFAGYLWLGRNRAWSQFSTTANEDNIPAPRNFQFDGYALLGIHGHNGVWDLLDNYLAARDDTWIKNYRAGDNNFTFIREKGYFLKFLNTFVMTAPDSFPRSDGTTTSLNGTTTVDGDLTDGRKDFYRDDLNIDIPGFILDDQTASGEWYESGGGNNAENDFSPYPPGAEQPWLVGLVADALGFSWRNTALSSTARDAARKMVLRYAAMAATRGYNTNIAADDPTKRWNEMWYLMGGGTRLNPYAWEHGSDSAILNNVPDNNMMAQYRQGNPFYLAPMGWAYEMSGQTIYKTWGEAIANAVFAAVGENTGGTGDGVKGLCDADNNYKDYGQCFRTSARFFANRLSSPASLGTPPSVTMPSAQTLTSGVNQVSLTANVACANSPCTYRWYFIEYPLVLGRWTPMPVFSDSTALTTKLSGLENGVYKVGFYALDNLGLAGTGTVNVTVGDGVFPPVVAIHKDGGGWSCTTSTSMTSINVRAYSAAGRTLTHSFSITGPKDAAAATVTPSGTTGNHITVDVSGITATSSSWYILRDIVTDSAGTARTAFFVISKHSTCGSDGNHFTQPSSGHNTIPVVNGPANHVLPAGSTSTNLYVTPIDPEGSVIFNSTATGYGQTMDGIPVVNALTHSWSQTAGPVSATITNGSTLRPAITGMTTAGTYTFQYSGTDQQGDTVTRSINVVTQAAVGIVFYQANLQHGQGTDLNFDFQRQIDALDDADIIGVQERTTSETGWNTPLTTAGYSQAVYLENNSEEGDGPAIWVKNSTVTVNQTYTRALATGTNPSCGSPNVGWNCTTDVRKSAVAAKVTVQGQQFYVVSVHGCWSRCNNSSSTTLSLQRENQMNDLVSWINSTLTGGLDIVILGDMNFAPDTAKTTGGLIKDILTASYTDLWNAGITASVATTPWGDRDVDSVADMTPADIGTQTTGTRTHDTRRIDYVFLKTSASALSLSSISVPDSRATCSVALTTGGIFKQCPDVHSDQLWDVTDDQGVRMSDHNPIRVVLNVAPASATTTCRWSTSPPCTSN